MNWELFYLVCFVVGFTFSVFSFVGGLGRLHLHFPKHLHFGGGGGGHVSGHVGSAGHVGHVAGHGAHASQPGVKGTVRGAHFPIFNPMTLAAFLTWFGGTGYLLEHLRHIWVFAGLALAFLAGAVGATIVFLFV
ncbi:MAG TPA: hypothetical protein VJ723_04500, partial [Candidatus Angelobacter sp.]|nr:hypothetical protein [Candidatus Angelobacter sp.]